MRPIGLALRRGAALAAALTLVLTQQAAAVQWSPVAAVSKSGFAGAFQQSTMVTGTQKVHLGYTDATGDNSPGAFYKSSGDGGLTWSVAKELSRPSAYGAIALAMDGAGTTLDLVVMEFDASGNYHNWYRRSLNNGRDWQPLVRLTPLTGDAGHADVSRAGSRVVVAWTDGASGKVFVRISSDGGASFGSKKQVGSTSNQPYSDSSSFDAFVNVEDAAGTINLVWTSAESTIRTRRSTDGGATWTAPSTLATNSNGRWTMLAAAGVKVIVGYTSAVDGHWRATQRRSTNEGATWKAAGLVGGNESFNPIFAFRDGQLRTTFSRCTVSDCSAEVTYFRTSTDFGASWSSIARVSRSTDGPWAYPAGLGALANGESVVIYVRQKADGARYLYARKTL